MGARIHLKGEGPLNDMILAALADADLPEDAAEDRSYDEALRESHHAGMDPLGADAGTPVIHVPGPSGDPIAFFGPVITPAPRGEAAGTLWDGVVALAATDGFFEFKRSRDRDAIFD
jgi:hypothetical protein